MPRLRIFNPPRACSGRGTAGTAVEGARPPRRRRLPPDHRRHPLRREVRIRLPPQIDTALVHPRRERRRLDIPRPPQRAQKRALPKRRLSSSSHVENAPENESASPLGERLQPNQIVPYQRHAVKHYLPDRKFPTFVSLAAESRKLDFKSNKMQCGGAKRKFSKPESGPESRPRIQQGDERKSLAPSPTL